MANHFSNVDKKLQENPLQKQPKIPDTSHSPSHSRGSRNRPGISAKLIQRIHHSYPSPSPGEQSKNNRAVSPGSRRPPLPVRAAEDTVRRTTAEQHLASQLGPLINSARHRKLATASLLPIHQQPSKFSTGPPQLVVFAYNRPLWAVRPLPTPTSQSVALTRSRPPDGGHILKGVSATRRHRVSATRGRITNRVSATTGPGGPTEPQSQPLSYSQRSPVYLQYPPANSQRSPSEYLPSPPRTQSLTPQPVQVESRKRTMPYNNAAIPPPEEITGSASLPCKISPHNGESCS